MRSKSALVVATALCAALLTNPVQGATASVRVNEVSCSGADWVELHNPTKSAVDISNWILSDRPDGGTARHQFAIARGTVMQPGAFLVLDEGLASNQLTWGVNCADGEEVFLFSSLRPAVTKVDSLKVPPGLSGFTYGRLNASASGRTISTRGKANLDGRPALVSATTLRCTVGKSCKHVLKISNGGKAALAKAVAGVKLSNGTLTFTARKKQTLKIAVRLTNPAGSKPVTLSISFA